MLEVKYNYWPRYAKSVKLQSVSYVLGTEKNHLNELA